MMGFPELRKLAVEDLQSSGISPSCAGEVRSAIDQALRTPLSSAFQVWRSISSAVLHPDHPLELHSLLFRATFAAWDEALCGPRPAWCPPSEAAAATNAARFMVHLQSDPTWRAAATGDPCRDWNLLQSLSCSAPETFWPPVLRELRIRFHTPPSAILRRHPTDPDAARWLPGARLNVAECALAGRDPDAPAIVWAEEGLPTRLHTVTRRQLAQQAQHVADALRAWGLRPGDAVGIDLPMAAATVAVYLGIVLAGCSAVCIAESFAAREISARLRIAGARAVFTQDVVLRGGKALPLYAKVAEAQAPRAVVLPAAGGGAGVAVDLRRGDLSWAQFLALAPEPTPSSERQPALRPHVADAYDTATVLFSSGTTGDPKAIPWTHVTPLRAAADAFFHQDVRPGDAVCWPTSMGWMMGPWLVYAALLNGASLALFEGSPLGRPFGQFVAAAKVAVLGVVPSIVKAWRSSGCMTGLVWEDVRCFSSTGEASSEEEYLWLYARCRYGAPVIEYCGGTEIGGAFLTGSMLQPQAPAAFSTPSVGARPVLLPSQGPPSPHAPDAAAPLTGELALTVPMLGVSQRLLNRSHSEVYYDGMPAPFLRRHGDEVMRLPGGYYRALGRVDDTMNLGGIKVASVELERAVTEGVAVVAEAAAVAVPPAGGGPDRLVLCLVLRQPGGGGGGGAASASEGGSKRTPAPAELRRACQAAISSRLNPLFKVDQAVVVAALPRTASNKVMRRQLRDELARCGGRRAKL